MLLRSAAVAATMLATLAATAGPAAADTRGELAFTPPASIDTAAIKAHTPAGCPAPSDGYYAVARGHGFPPDGQMVTTPTAAGMSTVNGFDVYFAQTMKDFAADNHTVLSGRYAVSVFCVDSFTGTRYAEFTGALTFTSPTSYRASNAAAAETPPAATGAPASPPADAADTTPAPPPPSTAAIAVAAQADPSPPRTRLPYAWIGATVAVLLAFAAGHRTGRRSAS